MGDPAAIRQDIDEVLETYTIGGTYVPFMSSAASEWIDNTTDDISQKIKIPLGSGTFQDIITPELLEHQEKFRLAQQVHYLLLFNKLNQRYIVESSQFNMPYSHPNVRLGMANFIGSLLLVVSDQRFSGCLPDLELANPIRSIDE